MHCESPFYLFDPSSIGSLYRRDRAGEMVPMADLKRIFDNDPDLFRDPVLQKHFDAALSGHQPKKPLGRKPLSFSHEVRILGADGAVRERAAAIKAARKANGQRERTALAPVVEAANQIANEWRFNCSGLTLLNKISSQKKPGYLMRALGRKR